MTSEEESMDQQLQSIAAAWRSVRGLGERIAAVKRAGLSWRVIARRTGIPMTTARRWAEPHLADDPASLLSLVKDLK